MDKLVDSLMKAVEKKVEHDKALAEYSGYDWGYHGYRETEAMREAASNFKEELRDFIRETVSGVLAEENINGNCANHQYKDSW